MLKRQRPFSPPPTFSSVPFVIADPPADLVGRDTKRRRTLPPVLDGASRGWAQTPPLSIGNVEDDEEDYISDDEIENIAPNFSINCCLTQQQQQQPGDKAEYASANSFLRELHTLQQHRLLFSSPPPPASSFLSCGSNSKDVSYSSNILSYSGHPPLPKGHSNLPAQLPIERSRVSSHLSPTLISKLSQQPSCGLPFDEINSVTEHYEGTNKYVVFMDSRLTSPH